MSFIRPAEQSQLDARELLGFDSTGATLLTIPTGATRDEMCGLLGGTTTIDDVLTRIITETNVAEATRDYGAKLVPQHDQRGITHELMHGYSDPEKTANAVVDALKASGVKL